MTVRVEEVKKSEGNLDSVKIIEEFNKRARTILSD